MRDGIPTNGAMELPHSASPARVRFSIFNSYFNGLLCRPWLVHNHPSGDPTPSSADVDMTRQVVEAGRSLRITVHDHLVVARDGVASFKALGLF